MIFPDDFVNKIINGDCVSIMKQMPDACLDLIVTSPPYNLKKSVGNNCAMPHDEYVQWQKKCLFEMFRLLKDDGAIFYNHRWCVQAGILQDRQDIVSGFPVRQIIIWRTETGSDYDPGSFLSTYDVIYLIAKPEFKLTPEANSHGDIWDFPREVNNIHPTPFPVALIERIISSTYARLILDPFSGSGTTAVAAALLDRNYIGIELSPEYCNLSEQRLGQRRSD